MKTLFVGARRLTALTSLGLVATPLIAVATPALAADACGTTDPAATEVRPGVCEVQFVEAGTYTFSAPSGVAKLTALIVGAGGGWANTGGPDAYGGGGGAVVYVTAVDTTSPVAIEVGLGVDGSSNAGGSSSVNSDVAAGGFSGLRDGVTGCMCGGSSGNGNAGWTDQIFGAGGGAGGAAPDQYSGGPGVTASEAANDADMWPALAGEPAYGAGGDVIVLPSIAGVAGSGANTDAASGEDGLVILRWTMGSTEPALVNTGLTTWSIVLGALLAGVLFFVASGSFKAQNELRFAGSRQRLVALLRDADERLRRAEKRPEQRD